MSILGQPNMNTLTQAQIQHLNSASITLSNTGSSGLNLYGSSPTVTISSMLDTISINDPNRHPDVKKYEIYESPEDVLALSVAWKRLRDNKQSNVGSLLHRDLFQHLTPDDKVKADAIRDYYSKKIMMIKLKDERRMTPFRNDLIDVIKNNGKMVKENMLGMIYYLPEFYQYDCDIDYVRSCVDPNQNFSKLDKDKVPGLLKLTCNLSPIKKIVKKRKRLTRNQYWFRDDKVNGAVLISIAPDNPLEHIWNHLFDSNKVLQVEGKYSRMKMDDFEYFSVDKWNLVQD